MKVRALTSLGIAVVGIPLLIFSEYIIFPIALSILAFISAFEMLRALGVHKNAFVAVPSYILALALPFPTFFMAGKEKTYILIIALSFFAFLLYLFFLAVFMRGALKFSDIGCVFISLVYVIVSFTSFGILRYLPGGLWNLCLIFVGAWGCDVFAYLVGSMIGKHKLIPEISPKKTVEGSLGGIICATGGFALFGFIVSLTTESIPNYPVLLIAGFISSIVAQLGDLIASLIKREKGIKDYGNILPGHGGIMDRFDSALAVSCVLMVICLLFPPFK